MSFADEQASAAADIRDQMGALITIKRSVPDTSATGYNPATGIRATVDASIDVLAVRGELSDERAAAVGIQAGDYLVATADLTWIPDDGDSLTDGTVERAVTGSNRILGGTQLVIHTRDTRKVG